jgi:branched-chain amino acid transport system substrate-binding protein
MSVKADETCATPSKYQQGEKPVILSVRRPAKSRTYKPFLSSYRRTDNGVLREDGRMVHSMFLFEVKKPEESKAPWDYYKLLAEVPGDQAFRPLKDGGCPLVK